MVNNIDKYRIGLDDVFAFKCRSCGKCCKNREDIILNSRDVYNIATTLNLTNKQIIDKYCESYIGQVSRIPVVRLKSKGINRVCPLLVENRCSVHSLKPTVCALFPIGRVISSEHAPEEMNLGNPYEIGYIQNYTNCGSARRKQTVRAWLESFNIPIDDNYFIQWNTTIFKSIETVKKYESMNNVREICMNMIWDAIYQAFYIDYDICKEFQPQFDSNVSKLLRTLEQLI